MSEVDHGDTHEVAPAAPAAPVAPVAPAHVVRVRLGHGANCSSIGSVVDTLFATAAVGAAVFAAVVAALANEPVRERRPVTPGAGDPLAGPRPPGDPPP